MTHKLIYLLLQMTFLKQAVHQKMLTINLTIQLITYTLSIYVSPSMVEVETLNPHNLEVGPVIKTHSRVSCGQESRV